MPIRLFYLWWSGECCTGYCRDLFTYGSGSDRPFDWSDVKRIVLCPPRLAPGLVAYVDRAPKEDVEALLRWAKERGIPVVEKCAEPQYGDVFVGEDGLYAHYVD